MFYEYFIFKALFVIPIPFIVLFLSKNKPIFKEKPHLLFVAMAVPTMAIATLIWYLGNANS